MINTTINITKEVRQDPDTGVVDFEPIRQSIKEALESNFYSILKRNGIHTISTLDAEDATDIILSISSTSNEIYVTRIYEGTTIQLATIQYNPYLSYVRYRQSVDDINPLFISLRNEYKPVATILLSVIIDGNICGFSLLSPGELQLIDAEQNLYSVRDMSNYDNYSNADFDVSTFPDVIKLQSKILFDKNSYYEISYSNINTPYESSIVPCVNSNIYTSGADSVTFKTLFGDLYADFETSLDDDLIGNVMMLPKILCSNNTDATSTTSNNIKGYTNTIFDCPQLEVDDYWNINNTFNLGDSIVIGDSEYLISNKNTLIQLTNTEIYGVNKTFTYDGKPHFFDLVYPKGGIAYYREAGIDNAEWILLPNDLSTITKYVDAQLYLFEYKVVLVTNNVEKEYYGNVQLNIENATQYGYIVEAYNGNYDTFPHSLYIYTDADVEYSIDNVVWSSVPPTFTNVGSYTVYYRLIKENYSTVYESVDISILSITPEEQDENNFGIDISKNIIVMREQLYSDVSSNLFMEVGNNNVLMSNTHPTYINVDNFEGHFPDPTQTSLASTILGGLQLTSGTYYLIIESYMPWYFQGVEPTLSNNNIDIMLLNNPITFSIDYCDGTVDDITDETYDWVSIAENVIPSNGFYEYKLTNISLDENPVGKLWDNTIARPSVKRLLVKINVPEIPNNYNLRTVRIKCNHTGDVIYNPTTSLEFNSTITTKNIGIGLVSLTNYTAPSSITFTNVNYGGTVYAQIPMKFKSLLSKDAFISYVTGYNLEYSGVAKLNYNEETRSGTTFPGIDTTTGIFEHQAITLWRNGSANSVTGNLKNNWTSDTYFTIIKNVPIRLQCNPNISEQPVDRINTDKIFAYLSCE